MTLYAVETSDERTLSMKGEILRRTLSMEGRTSQELRVYM